MLATFAVKHTMETRRALGVLTACAATGLLRACGLFFLILGLLKIHGVVYPDSEFSAYLALSNPICVFLSNRAVFSVASLTEISVGVYCVRSRYVRYRAAALLWLSACMLLYRFLLGFIKYDGPCGCLYGLHHLLPMTTGMQRELADCFVLFTLVCSVLGVIVEWRVGRREQREAGCGP